MLNQLLETIIQILTGWLNKFDSHAQHVEDKLDSLDQTASDIETNTEPISDIADNTGAVITPIQNIKSNTDSIKQSSQTSANNTTAILNNVSTLSTNTGRAAAFAEDCANNTLDIKAKVTTIASDTTQLRADAAELNDMSDKIYEAIKWILVDKVITETVEGNNNISFDTDLTNDLVSLEVSIECTQSGTGDPSPSNVRPITGVTDKSVTINGNNVTIALGQTVYGGTLNVTTGELIVTHGSVDLGSLTWRYNSTRKYFESDNISNIKTPATSGTILDFAISDIYVPQSASHIYNDAEHYNYTFAIFGSGYFGISNQNYTDAPTFKTTMSGHHVVYELVTPIEVQLTPQQITTIKGINTITTDGSIKATYKESIKHYLDKQDN